MLHRNACYFPRMYVQRRTPFLPIYFAAFPRFYIREVGRFELRITPATAGARTEFRALEFRLPVGQLLAGRFLRCKYPTAVDWRFAVIPIYEPTILACSCTGLLRRKVGYLSSQGSSQTWSPLGNFGSARDASHSIKYFLKRNTFQRAIWVCLLSKTLFQSPRKYDVEPANLLILKLYFSRVSSGTSGGRAASRGTREPSGGLPGVCKLGNLFGSSLVNWFGNSWGRSRLGAASLTSKRIPSPWMNYRSHATIDCRRLLRRNTCGPT